jgi:hypothetical protein
MDSIDNRDYSHNFAQSGWYKSKGQGFASVHRD